MNPSEHYLETHLELVSADNIITFSRKMMRLLIIVSLLSIIFTVYIDAAPPDKIADAVGNTAAIESKTSSTNTTSQIVKEVIYMLDKKPLRMTMYDELVVMINLTLNKNEIPMNDYKKVEITIAASTISPQFNILSIDGKDSIKIDIPKDQLVKNNFVIKANLLLRADYIGYAVIKPTYIEFENSAGMIGLNIADSGQQNLPVTITSYQGTMQLIFIVSVSIFIVITYINLGAQLDTDNMKTLLSKPMPLIFGSMISVGVMPLMAWFIGKWLLSDQLIYRIGAFVFSVGPAATASTLWAVMLDADKELSVGIQIVSTVVALFTMPFLLYFMELGLKLEGNTTYDAIKVPYFKLVQTLFVLLFALLVGWHFIGKNPKAQKFSRKIFRPLTFSVLLFIIVFSTALYWYIYIMFNWTIVLTAVSINLATYCLSGLLGHLINCNKDHSIAISIGSTYKNSGIAFAVLLIAFDSPDVYIAFVPCLTQVLTTSLTLYLIYSSLKLVNCVRRIGQPDPIQATSEDPGERRDSSSSTKAKQARSSSTASGKVDNDELVAMNVTDVVPGSPVSVKVTSGTTAESNYTTGECYNETTVSMDNNC